jgi:hypothetical protein
MLCLRSKDRRVDPDREWWLRVPAVLLSPRSVFAALRSDEQEDVEARSEPVLALTLLAGVAVALGTSTARRLYDDPLYDVATLAVWIVLAGGFVAFAGYFIVGGALYLGTRGLGSAGTFRRARHLLGFAVAPLALSTLLLWPLGLAVFGTDLFKRGGSDDGASGDLFYAFTLAFSLWAVTLLLVGVRTVHGWSWWRSLAALGLVGLFLAAFSFVF